MVMKSLAALRRPSLSLSLAAALLSLASMSMAQTIPNPSFETDVFSVAPGYVSDNAAITGWTTDNPGAVGLNPAGGDSSIANNGAVPQGNNVAFVVSGATLSTTISGLTAGKVYKVTLQMNATAGQSPILRANVDGSDLITLNVYPVGAAGTTRPYEYLAFEFTAAATTATLAFSNDAPDGTSTLLIDNLTIAESPGRWQVSQWSDDATSGVDNQFVYTHAYSFGSAASPLVNGILFTGVGGANPRVTDRFAATHFGNVFNNDANNISGGSAALARDFIYSGANVDSGDYQTITVTNLTPGTEYVVTIYTVGWENPTTSARWATFSVGEDRLTINQDQFGDNNGQTISYRYTAPANGQIAFNIAPVNPVNVSIHVYGFSNREAVSRNVAPSVTAPPASTTVAQGLPVELRVAVAGFPAPTFQWRKDGQNITGATSDTYTIAAAGAGDVGNYEVVVSNSQGSVTSVAARVTVGLPMANPSFEADSFVSWPGYSGENPGGGPDTPAGPNGPITGWTQSGPENSGINPISNGASPFADNGAIPHGAQVAFIQSIGADVPNTISQVIDGLTVGSQYYLHYYENSRAATAAPALEVTLGGVTIIPAHSVPSGAYREVTSETFTATAASLELAFVKTSPAGGDTTLLLDNVAVVLVASGTPPSVVQNPQPASGFVGGSATFTAQVSGSQPFTFQWLKNGQPIAGATEATLTLSNLDESAEADYSLRVTNSGGTITTDAARLTLSRIVGLFNTGTDNSHAPLADGEVDPHYKLIENPHVASEDAIVEDSTAFPIVAGPWLANTVASKWIGPEVNTVAGAIGLYTYRLAFDLTGRDPQSVVIRGRWASDNAGRQILVNGVATANAQSPGFGEYTPFAIYGTNTTFNAGANTLDFVVENEAAIGYTGLRVEFLESNSSPAGGGGMRLSVSRDGNSITVSWTPTAPNQKLQSATNILGPWGDVQNATNPYTTTTSGTLMFFRVSQ